MANEEVSCSNTLSGATTMTSAGGIHHDLINIIAAAQMSGIVLNRSDLRAAAAAHPAPRGNHLSMHIVQALQHALEALHRRILGVQRMSGIRGGRMMSQAMIVKGAIELVVANAAMGRSSHASTAC